MRLSTIGSSTPCDRRACARRSARGTPDSRAARWPPPPRCPAGPGSRVDRRQHIGRQIDWQADQFADHRGGDDAAVILGEVERAARQQFVEPLVGQGADPIRPRGRGFRPELARGATPDRVVDRGVEVRVERQRVQRRIGDRAVVARRQNRCRGQGSLRGDECSVVDRQHLPDVLEARQRVGVPLVHVVHRMLVAQHPVVRRRIGHHCRGRTDRRRNWPSSASLEGSLQRRRR